MSESEPKKNADSLPESPNREGEAPSEPAPEFASPETQNPYQSPEHVGTPDRQPEERGPSGSRMTNWILCLVFLPLVLGNLCFWPTMLLGAHFINDSYQGAFVAAMIALAVCGIGGIVYGVFMARYGMRVMYGRDWRRQPEIRSRYLPLVIGLGIAELFLFPASVFGGCLGFFAFLG